MITESIRAKLETLPRSPGVYLFRGHRGEVLYVGKARSLRSRVRSYFQERTSDLRAFIAHLDEELGDIETFVVKTEKEAALLENQLIKEHQPRYNVRLRDDKDYLSLRLDSRRDFPRLQVVRRPKNDGADYFGPYDSASGARQTLRLINRHFQLRTCTDRQMRARSRPCLQYQIHRCPAPCVGKVAATEYADQVRSVALFLQGRHDELVEAIEARMHAASADLEYERAAVFRDQLQAVQRVREQQHVVAVRERDQDVIGFFRQADNAEIALLVVRAGKLVGVRTFGFAEIQAPDDELLGAFVSQYYDAGVAVPDEILLPLSFEAMEGLGDVLTEKRARRVVLRVPQRGGGKRLLAMAEENAAHAFREKQRSSEDLERRLAQIQEALRLERPPRAIECIDISHTAGRDTFAAIVRIENGTPAPERYRSFRLRGVSGGDDYGAIAEALQRRLLHATEAGWELPDLLLIDGGRGQLNVAVDALGTLRSQPPEMLASQGGRPELASLAKEAERSSGRVYDRVYRPNRKNPVELRAKPALALLALARDEAHRFSNAARRRAGRKRLLRSDLEEIQGIGAKTRQRLLNELGSLAAIAQADENTLRAAGATRAQARAIVEHMELLAAERADGQAIVANEETIDDRALRNALGLSEGVSDESPTPAPTEDARIDSAEAEEAALDNAFDLDDESIC